MGSLTTGDLETHLKTLMKVELSDQKLNEYRRSDPERGLRFRAIDRPYTGVRHHLRATHATAKGVT